MSLDGKSCARLVSFGARGLDPLGDAWRTTSGPEPDWPALRRVNGTAVVRPGDVVEIDRTVTKDGVVSIAGSSRLIGFAWAGRRVTLRLDGHLMHAVIDNALIGTWPCPIGTDQLGRLTGARTLSTPLPPGSLRGQRKVHASGRIMVAGQNIKLRPRHRGKIVTVVISTVRRDAPQAAVPRNGRPDPVELCPGPATAESAFRNRLNHPIVRLA